jgi:heptaprenyl diphosphate synthase
LLDVTGGSSELGKPAGNDLRQGTVTLPTLLYSNKLDKDSDAWRQLDAVVNGRATTDVDVKRVIEGIRGSGAVDETVQVAEIFVGRAKSALALTPESESRDLLASIADLAVNRAS